jgi:hypothetical protein
MSLRLRPLANVVSVAAAVLLSAPLARADVTARLVLHSEPKIMSDRARIGSSPRVAAFLPTIADTNWEIVGK